MVCGRLLGSVNRAGLPAVGKEVVSPTSSVWQAAALVPERRLEAQSLLPL